MCLSKVLLIHSKMNPYLNLSGTDKRELSSKFCKSKSCVWV